MATAQISENRSVGDAAKLKEPSSRGDIPRGDIPRGDISRGDIPRSEATLPARGRSIGGQTLKDTSTVELIDLEKQSRSIKRLAELKSEECEIYKLLDRRLRSSLSQRGILAQPSGVRPGVSTITQVVVQPPPPRTKSPAPQRPTPPPSPRPRSPRTARSPRAAPRTKSPARPAAAHRGRSRSPAKKRAATPAGRRTKQRRSTTPSKRSPRSASPRPRSATRSPARSGTRSPRRARTAHTARSPTPKATPRSQRRQKGTGRSVQAPKKPTGYPSIRQLVPVFYATTFWALYCFNTMRMVIPPSL